jgi:hypothetical protein
MEPQYSAFADLLNKFHTAPMLIQALWLGTLTVVAWHLVSVAGRVLEEFLLILDRRDARRTHAEYTIHREIDGRWILTVRGQIRELTLEDVARLPPP